MNECKTVLCHMWEHLKPKREPTFPPRLWSQDSSVPRIPAGNSEQVDQNSGMETPWSLVNNHNSSKKSLVYLKKKKDSIRLCYNICKIIFFFFSFIETYLTNEFVKYIRYIQWWLDICIPVKGSSPIYSADRSHVYILSFLM